MTIASGTAGALCLQEVAQPPARPPRAPTTNRRRRGYARADRGRDDPRLGDVAAGEGLDHPPPRKDDHLVAKALEFGGVGGFHHDRLAGIRDLAQDPVDLCARADVDPLRRFVGDDQAGVREQRARQHHLLLVAAGERCHRRLDARRLQRQRPERVRDLFDLAPAADDPERRERLERRHRRILAHGEVAGQSPARRSEGM